MDLIAIANANKVKVSAKTLLSASGFLFAGILWGLQIAKNINQGGNFISPFVYIMGAIYLAIFGTLTFTLANNSPADSNDIKKIFWNNDKEIFYSLIFWFILFIVLGALSYNLFLLGKISYIFSRLLNTTDSVFQDAINIKPILFGDLWIGFFIIALLSIIFYAKIFQCHAKIKRSFWMIPASFLIPAISNLFSDITIKIVICTALLCFILGIIISASVKKNENTLF
jgi:hypothetical protein